MGLFRFLFIGDVVVVVVIIFVDVTAVVVVMIAVEFLIKSNDDKFKRSPHSAFFSSFYIVP